MRSAERRASSALAPVSAPRNWYRSNKAQGGKGAGAFEQESWLTPCLVEQGRTNASSSPYSCKFASVRLAPVSITDKKPHSAALTGHDVKELASRPKAWASIVQAGSWQSVGSMENGFPLEQALSVA